MSLMKGAILFSARNAASLNIMGHLEKDWKWKKKDGTSYSFSPCAKEDCCSGVEARGQDASIIEIVPPADAKADYFLYASTHKSEKGQPALTAHLPGNWGPAGMGGNPRTLNMAYACKLKQILQLLAEGAKKHNLGWEISMEVDHHGPTPQNGKWPLIFVEIGSGPEQWGNETAGAVVAEAMMKALFQPAKAVPAHLGIGGPHYAPNFTKRMLEGELAVGHVVPKYACEYFSAEMLKQAMERNVEKLEGALLDWKGIPGEQRERIVGLLDGAGVKWKKL